MSPEKRRELKERWHQMTPEQREQMRERSKPAGDNHDDKRGHGDRDD
jgi:hypothetical protein